MRSLVIICILISAIYIVFIIGYFGRKVNIRTVGTRIGNYNIEDVLTFGETITATKIIKNSTNPSQPVTVCTEYVSINFPIKYAAAI